MNPRSLPFLLASTLITAFLVAQSPAEALIQQSKWSEAAAAFEVLTHQSPGDATAWAGLGLADLNLGRIDAAEAAYAKALALDPKSARATVGVARVAIARGDKKAAIVALGRAQVAGIPVFQAINTTPGIEALSKDPEFAGYLATLRPCGAAEYHQFDFWLGDWDVFDPTGQKIGTNSITSTNGGCVLFENWKDVRGGSGNSFNFYETATKRWHQFWVASGGNAAPLAVAADGTPMPMSGGLVEGRMVLLSPATTKPLNRWTWSKVEGGKVRQLAEQSADGVTWTVNFDGLYVKAK